VSGNGAGQTMRITLHVWRQETPTAAGKLETYKLDDVTGDMSFLEMFDHLNEKLVERGEEPVAFSHDCREGICGSCAMMINGAAHGPMKGAATCQLHMRSFKDGDEIVVEPWRARAFPVIKDLAVDRRAFDRIIQAGGYISAPTGTPQDANALPIPKPDADLAMDSAACIGCGQQPGLHPVQDQPADQQAPALHPRVQRGQPGRRHQPGEGLRRPGQADLRPH